MIHFPIGILIGFYGTKSAFFTGEMQMNKKKSLFYTQTMTSVLWAEFIMFLCCFSPTGESYWVFGT